MIEKRTYSTYYEFKDAVDNRLFSDWSCVRESLLSLYSRMCTDEGKDVFTECFLPKLREVYGDNYHAAGKEALKVLTHVSRTRNYDRPFNRNKYFQEALQDKLLRRRDGLISISEIEEKINHLIQKTTLQQPEEVTICGAIIFGSYAKETYHPDSDLDLIPLTKEKIKDVTKLKKFREEVRSATGLYVDNALCDGVGINNKEKLKLILLHSCVTKGYIIISPYQHLIEEMNVFASKLKEEAN